MEEKKNPFSWLIWFILTILVCIVTGLVVYNNTDKIDQIMSENSTESQIIDELSSEKEEVKKYSIAEILQWREHTKELQRVDSVYLNMPDVILIDILLQHGTSLSYADIVYIYESNPETYNLIQSGARAQRYKDSISITNPLPIISEPDFLTPNIDSICRQKQFFLLNT